MVPVNPNEVPVLDKEKLKTYPPGYRFLTYFQEATMGVTVKKDMPGHRRENDSPTGKVHNILYWQCKKWLDGEAVEV